MHSRWQAITHHWRRTVVLFSVALLIAWNFATITHQLDLVPEHHSHHHCQMFAGAQHGLVQALPALTPPPVQHSAHSNYAERQAHSHKIRHTARDPPYLA